MKCELDSHKIIPKTISKCGVVTYQSKINLLTMIQSTKVTSMMSSVIAVLSMANMGSVVAARSIGLLRNDLSSSIRTAYRNERQDEVNSASIHNIFGINQERELHDIGSYEAIWDPSVSISMSLSMSLSMPTDLISDFPSLTPSFAPSMDTNAGQLPSDIPSYVRGASTSISPSGSQGKEEIKEVVAPTQSPTSQLIPRVEGESPKQKDAAKPRGISNIVPTIVVLIAASALLIGLFVVRRRMRSSLMTSVEDMSSNESLSSSVNGTIHGAST